jgi:FdrA protein
VRVTGVQDPAAGQARVEVRSGAYHDSVTLMQVSRAVAAVPGVLAAQVAMGTELNLDVLRGMGFALPVGLGSADLVVAIRAVDDAAHAAASSALAAALAPSRAGGSGASGGLGGPGGVRPRTVGSAARALPDPDGAPALALISVPGPYAFVEAMDAVEAGLDVMVFSDNVPVEQEVRLKDAAALRGRLVMGPDCGTAVIDVVGLGFANVVRPGPVGLVAASGTGAQQVMCLLDAAGVGVRHCLGVGGRDLSEQIGGRATRAALALLDADPQVELIVLVSKPPAPRVEAELAGFVAGLATPVRLALLGPGRPDLTQAARTAVEAVGADWPALPHWPGAIPPEPAGPATQPLPGRYTRLRAGFAGGTLCDEAMLIATERLGPIASNIPLPGAPRLSSDLVSTTDGASAGHVMIDFGDDELTRGRPHPMIDSTLRARWLADQAAAVPAGHGIVVLIDVVLGLAADPDPAAELAPAIAAARGLARERGAELAAVVSLCGTGSDPQGLERQAEALAASGADVYVSNAEATRAALALLHKEAR